MAALSFSAMALGLFPRRGARGIVRCPRQRPGSQRPLVDRQSPPTSTLRTCAQRGIVPRVCRLKMRKRAIDCIVNQKGGAYDVLTSTPSPDNYMGGRPP